MVIKIFSSFSKSWKISLDPFQSAPYNGIIDRN